jgi:AcrR family transcriptional regulator
MVRVTPEHTDARVRDILRAGAKVFAEHGSEKATMAEIAREAGISAGALYLYFPNKAELLRAVCSMKHEGIDQILSAEARDGETPMESLTRIARQMAEVYEQPDVREQTICALESVLFAARDPAGFGQEQREINAHITTILATLMTEARDAGELDTRHDPGDVAIVLYACALGLRELKLISPEFIDSRRAFATLSSLVQKETVAGQSSSRTAK